MRGKACTGRPRKIKTPEQFDELWIGYKDYCDNQSVLTHRFSGDGSEFVSKELKHSITYTIKGFCKFVGISCQAFYKYYSGDKRFVDSVTRAREECEVDAREKFELGLLPVWLAPLWMGNYGYTKKADGDTDILSELNKTLKKEKNHDTVRGHYAEGRENQGESA